MFKKLFIGALLVAPFTSDAAFFGSARIDKIYGSEIIRFGMQHAPTDKTCDYHGRHFQFDSTTDGGKAMLAILLTAHATKQKVYVWFDESTAPGTTHENGCTGNTMAQLTKIGFVGNGYK